MLSTYADGDGRGARPGIARLVADTGCHKETVVDAVAMLREAGVIEPDKDPPREGKPRRGPAAAAWQLTIPHGADDACPYCANWSDEPTSNEAANWSAHPDQKRSVPVGSPDQ